MSTAGHRRCDTVCGRRRRGDRGASMTPPPDSPAPCWPLAPAPARPPGPLAGGAGAGAGAAVAAVAVQAGWNLLGPIGPMLRVLESRPMLRAASSAAPHLRVHPARRPALRPPTRQPAHPRVPRRRRSRRERGDPRLSHSPGPHAHPALAIRRPRPCRDPAADPASPRRAHPAQRRRSRRPHRPDRRTTTHLVIAFLPPDPTTPAANGPHPSQRSVDAINESLTNRAIARAPAPTPRTVASLPAPPAACDPQPRPS